MTESTAHPLVFDVTDADFPAAGIERSHPVPVLLACWAPWCGPCRSLTPVLEKLAAAYEGRFVLAKLDSDQNPQMAAALGLRSIPHVILFQGGRPVDQFQGALPEGQVRAFLDNWLQPASPAEQLREQAQTAEPAEARRLLREALALDPDNPALLTDLAERTADSDPAGARELVERIPEPLRDERQQALLARLAFAELVPEGDAQALQARIEANPRDHDARHDLAAILAHRGDFESAFDQLLETVLRDKAEARERARARMVEWFQLCPDPALVDKARRRLSMYLN